MSRAFTEQDKNLIEPAMSVVEYLRQQAAACHRLARATFDLTTAEQLRFLAAELRAKAEQIENAEEDVEPHMIRGNGFSGSSGSTGENGHG